MFFWFVFRTTHAEVHSSVADICPLGYLLCGDSYTYPFKEGNML